MKKKLDFNEWQRQGFQRIISFRKGRPFEFIEDDFDRAVYILGICAGYPSRTIARLFSVSRHKVSEAIYFTRSVSTTFMEDGV
jgi:hypothetical protein